MAKQQTFGDKLKKKSGPDTFNVKFIYAEPREENGSLRILERFRKFKDVKDAETFEFNKG